MELMAKHGVGGTTEINAITGERSEILYQIVEEAIKKITDPDLPESIRKTDVENRKAIEKIWKEVLREHDDKISDLQREIDRMENEQLPRLKSIQQEIVELNAAIKNKAFEVQSELRKETERIYTEFKPEPMKKPEVEDLPEDCLYDSKRSYLEQLKYYKK